MMSKQKLDYMLQTNSATDKHVHFESQKEKVSLAAQTLSSPVAVALHTLRALGYPQFKDCVATADFIEVILHAHIN